MKEDILIQKWLNDELSAQEQLEFEKRPDYNMMVDILGNAHEFKASHQSEPGRFEDLMAVINKRDSGKIISVSWRSQLLRVAAILVIGLGVYFTFFNNPVTTIETLYAEKTEFSLPDDSELVLNANSSVSYRSRDWNTSRNLNLNGEAYFKVAKGQKFTVNTANGRVQVLGTQFNVKQRGDLFEVICFEGRVEVGMDSISHVLMAGDEFRALGSVIELNRHEDLRPAWLDNRSVFKSARIKDVIAELEFQYNVRVELQLRTANRLFTGGFTHDNLNEALQEITIPLNLRYEIKSDNRVVIDEVQ